MNRRWLSWLYVALFVAVLADYFLSIAFGFHQTDPLGIFFLPLSFISDMKTLLRKRPAPRTGTFAHVDWASFKPIHSTHWGEPPATT